MEKSTRKAKKTIQARQVARLRTSIEAVNSAIAYVDRTGLCVSCRLHPVYEIRPGAASMTCDHIQCKRAWLMGEPVRCINCQSLDIGPAGNGEGDLKEFECYTCEVKFSKGRGLISTIEDEDRAINEENYDW